MPQPFEVFNGEDQQIPLDTVAARACRSPAWLGEGMLRRAMPLNKRMPPAGAGRRCRSMEILFRLL